MLSFVKQKVNAWKNELLNFQSTISPAIPFILDES